MSIRVSVGFKKYWGYQLETDYIIIHRNSSEDFNIGHCPVKVKVKAQLLKFFSIYHNWSSNFKMVVY